MLWRNLQFLVHSWDVGLDWKTRHHRRGDYPGASSTKGLTDALIMLFPHSCWDALRTAWVRLGRLLSSLQQCACR